MVITKAFVAEDDEGVATMEILVEDVAWAAVREHGYINFLIYKVLQISCNLLSHDEKKYAREIL